QAGRDAGDEPRQQGRGVSADEPRVEVWLSRLVAGEREAAAWLYDGFAKHLYRRLRLRYGYPGGLNPDDLLHDAFVYFFQDRCAAMRRILERTPPEGLTPEALERRLWDLACGVASNHRRAARRRGITTPEQNAHLSEGAVAEREAVS